MDPSPTPEPTVTVVVTPSPTPVDQADAGLDTVLPGVVLWGVVFAWVACYAVGRWMGRG